MKSIIFNSENVRAILDNRKTQFRRVIKDSCLQSIQFEKESDIMYKSPFLGKDGDWFYKYQSGVCDTDCVKLKCPYGKVGDVLWVRETIKRNFEHSNFYYSADDKGVGVECYQILRAREKPYPKTISSRFMPKFLARIFLEITNIRVERVQDISAEDCMAEGTYLGSGEPNLNFDELWDSINKKCGYGWDVNPWVRCVEFNPTASVKR